MPSTIRKETAISINSVRGGIDNLAMALSGVINYKPPAGIGIAIAIGIAIEKGFEGRPRRGLRFTISSTAQLAQHISKAIQMIFSLQVFAFN